MSYKPDEKDWMAYLYGELEDADKEKFERYILQHPEVRVELEKFQNVRKILTHAEDKEVIAPPIFIGDSRPAQRGSRLLALNTPYFRMIITVAASLLLIILAGKISGTQLVVSDNEFRLTFGESAAKNKMADDSRAASALSPEEVQQMINASLQKNNAVVRTTLAEAQKKLESSLESSIRSNLARNSGRMDQIVREASSASQQQIRQYVDGIRTENMEQVKNYFQLTSTEQKKYIENLLVDFAKYLQQQRNNDLQLVQTRMNSIEQNTDLFKHETEQILSSIITTVGNPVSGERRN